MTTVSHCTAISCVFREIAAPALKNARSISSKEFTPNVWEASSSPRNLNVLPADRAAGQEFDRCGRKLPPLHDVENFDAYRASCANDCDSILSGHKERGINTINIAPRVVHVPLQLRIDALRQRLDLLKRQAVQVLSGFDFKFGPRLDVGSNKTPLGSLRSGRKSVRELPWAWSSKAAFPPARSRRREGRRPHSYRARSLARGVEETNANTKDRFIYIHGTNQEALCGTPVSHGCIRMSNADIAECFEEIAEGYAGRKSSPEGRSNFRRPAECLGVRKT